MPDKMAATLNKTTVRAFKPVPAPMRNPLTPDNGKEFAVHKELSQTLGIDVYFAHPYRSWKGGLTNIPTDLSDSISTKKNPV
jgi:IS30 family transposase